MTQKYSHVITGVHVGRKFYVVEVRRRIKLIELLITWSAQVEYEWEDRFDSFPFNGRGHDEHVPAVFLQARESLDRLKSKAENLDSYTMAGAVLRDMANTLARWRYKPVRDVWSSADILDLIDLSKYEP